MLNISQLPLVDEERGDKEAEASRETKINDTLD